MNETDSSLNEVNLSIQQSHQSIQYEVYFVHQCDNRQFNRGAMKNIGFLAMKNKYPDHYKEMTFVFHDIDTVPFHRLFHYPTNPGIVKHFYGFETALGGIVSIRGADFEALNGFPNYWGWGLEDACLQNRCLQRGLQIDRSQFFPTGSPEVLQFFDGVTRMVSKRNPQRLAMDKGVDGLATLKHLQWSIRKENESLNPQDNQYVVGHDRFFMINVTYFLTSARVENEEFHKYDLRDSPQSFFQSPQSPAEEVDDSNREWTNIAPFSESMAQSEELRECTPFRHNPPTAGPVLHPQNLLHAPYGIGGGGGGGGGGRRQLSHPLSQSYPSNSPPNPATSQAHILHQQRQLMQIQHSMMKAGVVSAKQVGKRNATGVGIGRAGRPRR